MPITPTEVQVVATAESAKIVYLSLHTASPSTTGANELSGGTPAYARIATTVTASGGTGTSTQVTFDQNQAATHFGTWSAITGGTFFGGNALSATSGTNGVQSQTKLIITLPVSAT